MTGFKWGTNTIISFIDEYQSRECLWDLKNSLYKDRDARNAAYREIVYAMSILGVKMTINSVKEKIRSLRNTFFGEIKKMKLSKKTGNGTDDIYTPKLQWFNSMLFLTTSNKMKETEKSLVVKTENISDSSRENTPPPKRKERSNKRSRMPQSSQEPVVEPLSMTIEELKRISSSRNEDDEFDVFGRNVALQLKKLPLIYALESQELIQKLLKEQRIKALKEQEREQKRIVITIPEHRDEPLPVTSMTNTQN